MHFISWVIYWKNDLSFISSDPDEIQRIYLLTFAWIINLTIHLYSPQCLMDKVKRLFRIFRSIWLWNPNGLLRISTYLLRMCSTRDSLRKECRKLRNGCTKNFLSPDVIRHHTMIFPTLTNRENFSSLKNVETFAFLFLNKSPGYSSCYQYIDLQVHMKLMIKNWYQIYQSIIQWINNLLPWDLAVTKFIFIQGLNAITPSYEMTSNK